MAKAPKQVKVETLRPRLMSYEDAARYLGISTKSLRNRVSDKNNPHYPFPVSPIKWGGKPFFVVEQLDALIDSVLKENGV